MLSVRQAVGLMCLMVIGAAMPSAAQVGPLEVTAGYQAVHVPDLWLPVGWNVDVAGNVTETFSIVGEVGGAYKTEEEFGVEVDFSLHTFGAGVRLSSRATPTFVPFVQVLAGAARAQVSSDFAGLDDSDAVTKFMLQPGGGVSVKIADAIGVVGQVDYRRIFLDEEVDGDSGENELRLFVGIRFGR